MLRAIAVAVSLLKLRISVFVGLAACVGAMLGEGRLSVLDTLLFALAVIGASGAAGGFNHYYERETDRLMARTRSRPFASGALQAGAVWPMTFAALLVASLFLGWSVGGTLASLMVFLGAATYGLVYTVWLKRRTVWNVVIGGAAGSFAVLAGALAAAPVGRPAVGSLAIVLALVLFLWTPPHFWSLAAARRDDYCEAGVPMLPAIAPPSVWGPIIFAHVAVLVALSYVPLWLGMGLIYGLGVTAGGVPFLWTSWRLMRSPTPANAMATFEASLVQFALLSFGVLLDEALQWPG